MIGGQLGEDMTLNGIVASTAATEVQQLITGFAGGQQVTSVGRQQTLHVATRHTSGPRWRIHNLFMTGSLVSPPSLFCPGA